MSDPNVDAWDRLCDEEDRSWEAQIAFYEEHQQDIIRCVASLISRPDVPINTPDDLSRVIDIAADCVLGVVSRGKCDV